MLYRSLIGVMALTASFGLTLTDALAFDESKYPDWKGAWRRVAVPGVVGQPSYDPTKRGGHAQEAPLTPEYQAIFEANLKDQAAGGQGTDPTYTCLSPGMPRVMTTFAPFEVLVTPQMTNLLIQHIHDSRRIFNDEITTIDNALTRPWTVTKKYARVPVKQPEWVEEVCAEGNFDVEIGKDSYFLSGDGHLMPTKK